MNTYIALLRGINVGGNNKLPMRDLVSLLEELGLQNVKTYIHWRTVTEIMAIATSPAAP